MAYISSFSCVDLARLNYVSQNSLPCTFPVGRQRERFGGSLEGRSEAAAVLFSTEALLQIPCRAYLLAQSVDVGQTGLQCSALPWIPLQLLWFLGHVCLLQPGKGQLLLPDTHVIKVRKTLRSDIGLSASSWVPACPCFFHSTWASPPQLPTLWTPSSSTMQEQPHGERFSLGLWQLCRTFKIIPAEVQRLWKEKKELVDHS